MADKDSLIEELVNQLPEGVDQYEYVMDWYADGDSSGRCRYLRNGDTVKIKVPFKNAREIVSNALKIVRIEKNNESNRVTILVGKDGNYSCMLEYIKSIDADRENKIREALGDEEYEKLKKESVQSVKKQEQRTIENKADESLTLGQLFGLIRDELQGSVPKGWVSLILKTSFRMHGQQQSIDADFLWKDEDGNEKLFEPENPITPMNALMQIKDIMSNDGNDWSKFKIIIHSNGEGDIQNQL